MDNRGQGLARCSAPFMAFLSVLAMSAQIGAGGVRAVWNSIEFVWVLLFFALWVLYSHAQQRAHERYSLGLAVAFACLTFIGRGVAATHTVVFLLPGFSNICVAVICFIGFFLIYRVALDWALGGIERYCDGLMSHHLAMPDATGSRRARVRFISFLKTAGVLLLLWSPWLIAYLPGAQGFDATSQVIMGSGMLPVTAHHPPFTTLLYTVAFMVGNAFGGVNAGTLCMLALQGLVLLLAMAYAIQCMKRWGVDRRVLLVIMAFWGLLPLVPIYVSWITKDTISAALFILFLTELGNILHAKQKIPWFTWVLLSVDGVVLCLTRHDSILCIVVAVLACAVVLRAQAKMMLACGAVILVVYTLLNSALMPALGIAPGNSRESLSFFVQATARCIREHPDDMTAQERAVLEACTLVDDLRQIGDVYDPTISDSVKALFDFTAPGASLTDYFRVWVSMGLRHPATYLASFLEGTLGYWYPFAHWGNVEVVEIPRSVSVDSNAVARRGVIDQWEQMYGGYGSMWFPALVDIANSVLGLLYNTPVVGQLFSPAAYIWLLAVCVVWLCGHKSSLLALASPLVVKFAICCASPLAGSIRYALPIVLGLPILMGAMTVRSMRSGK